jgi:flagellar basal body-associated protein FliL
MGDDERDIVEDEEKSQEPSGSTGTSKIVKILLYVAGGIIIIFLMLGISYLVSKSVTESKYQKDQDIIAAPPPEPLAIYSLPAFSKTTADAEPHFIKMQISLGYVADPMLNTELVNRKDEIQHIVNIILQGKTYEELNSVTGAITLAEEIKAHINIRLIAGKIKEIYYVEFVVN